MKKKTAPRMMRTKTTRKKSKKTDGQKFAILRRAIKKEGMHVVSVNELWKFLIKGGVPPDVERIKETLDQYPFKITVNGYPVLFYSSFNPTITKNDDKRIVGRYAEFGGMWIRIFDKDGNKIMTRKRFRGETNEKRLPLELGAIIAGLKKRPSFKNRYGKNKMFLWDPLSKSVPKHYPPQAIKNCKWYEKRMLNTGKEKPQLMWVSADISGEKKFVPFSKNLSDEQCGILRKLNYQRAYYYKNSDPKTREPETRVRYEVVIEAIPPKDYAIHNC